MLKRKDPNQNLTRAKKHRPNHSSPYRQTTLNQVLVASAPSIQKSVLQPAQFCFYPDIFKKLGRLLQACLTPVKYRSRKKTRKTFLVQGIEGSGKTFLVRSVVEALGGQTLELGVDSLRSAPRLKKVFAEATQSSVIAQSKNRVIFIDDVNIVLPPDIGFATALAELVTEAKTPIVLAGDCVPSNLVNAVKVLQLKTNEERLLTYFQEHEPDTELLMKVVRNSHGSLRKLFQYFACPKVEPEIIQTVRIEDMQTYSNLADLLVATDTKPKTDPGTCEFYRTAYLTEFLESRKSLECSATPWELPFN